MVGVASAKGWRFTNDCQTYPNIWTEQYHWASDHKIMIRMGDCVDGEFVPGPIEGVNLDSAHYDVNKAENWCEGALYILVTPPDWNLWGGPYGKPEITFHQWIFCVYPAGYWD